MESHNGVIGNWDRHWVGKMSSCSVDELGWCNILTHGIDVCGYYVKGGGCHMASDRWQPMNGRCHQREDDIHNCILNLGIKWMS